MYDCIVIGAGIAGASVAFELAGNGSVALVEAEERPGYHSTGRSAALFTPNYGNRVVRQINALSAPFFLDPPAGFAPQPLLTPRGLLTVAGPGAEHGLDAILALSTPDAPIEKLTGAEALALAPLLRPQKVSLAVIEPGVKDIDVDALHQAYLRGFRARGGVLACKAPVEALARANGHWKVQTGTETISARLLVNAAGAWAERIGSMAGASPIGLVPKRRTAIIVNGPDGISLKTLPAVDTLGSEAYFKPEAGRIMASLGDESPTEPHDAWPDELEIAMIADWLERHTILSVRRIEHSWAGLRSFVADGAPVVGYDGNIDDFFWLAAQGGYGIMMAPALARASSSLIQTGRLPDDAVHSGLSEQAISPARLRD